MDCVTGSLKDTHDKFLVVKVVFDVEYGWRLCYLCRVRSAIFSHNEFDK